MLYTEDGNGPSQSFFSNSSASLTQTHENSCICIFQLYRTKIRQTKIYITSQEKKSGKGQAAELDKQKVSKIDYPL